MINKLLVPVLEAAGKVIVPGATTLGKAVVEHFTKHGTKYLIGGVQQLLVVLPMPWENLLVIQKAKKKVQQNKHLEMKRNSMICINNMKMIASVGMKKNKLTEIYWME